MPVTSTLRTVVAALVVATTVVLLPSSPASAAGCAGATGVTVVVDFNQLRGDDLTTGCAARGGDNAAAIFEAAGYPLTYVSDSGFVCTVSGYPAGAGCARTPPATAYWSLWLSDGKSGKWTFARQGVSGLKVPTGGYVAFAWHQGSGNAAPPGVAPTPRVAPATPKPSAKPSPGAGTGGTGGGKGGQGGGSGKPAKPTAPATTATPSATTSPSASASTSPSPSAGATPTPGDASSATSDAPDPTDPGTSDVPAIDDITDGPPSDSERAADDTGDGGFPVWLGAGLVVVVLGAAAAVPILRRRG